MQIAQQDDVQTRIVDIRNQKILIDTDVAELYGVETKRINEAVKNNPEKFPEGYLFELDEKEKRELVENFDRFKKLKHSSATVKGFTERGLYMLATILKSPKAVETTIAIIDTFAKVKELGRVIQQMQTLPENSPSQRSLMEQTGDLIADLIIPDEDLEVTRCESTVNEVISKRMVKKQQMRWTKEGAHWLLQMRIRTLNEELHPALRRWYPKMSMADKVTLPLAA